MRYFLLDRITSVEVGQGATALKCISLSDEALHDHFPDYPVMPGALIVEGLAQLCGFLLEVTLNQDGSRPIRRALFLQIDRMKFHAISVPGDRLEMKASVLSLMEDAARFNVEARVGEEIRASGQLTMGSVVMESPKLNAHRLETYRAWTRGLKSCPMLR